jgi:o-succinylbenzoate---CoA ligase
MSDHTISTSCTIQELAGCTNYNQLFWSDSNTELTFSGLFKRVATFSSYIKNTYSEDWFLGIKLSNPLDTVVAIFALWNTGKCPVMLSHSFPEKHIQLLRSQVPFNHVISALPSTKEHNSSGFSPISMSQDGLIVFTSGNTGIPKGVLLGIDNILASSRGLNEALSLNEKDVWPVSLPLHHVAGLMVTIRCLLAGARSGFLNTRDIQQLANSSFTCISMVPTQLIRIINLKDELIISKLRACKAILLGGAPIPKWLVDECCDLNLPVFSSYGLTEMSSTVTIGRLTKSSGKCLPKRRIAINNQGRICVGGETLFKGHFVSGQLQSPVLKNGLFSTEDLGHIDEEQNLNVTGRADLSFVSGGENINPTEIERAIISITGICEAHVVPVNDNELGKIPVAFLRGTDGSKCTETIIEKLKRELPSYKIPRHFFNIDDIEHQGIKLTRPLLSQLAFDLLSK